jgi:hypothetical protein
MVRTRVLRLAGSRDPSIDGTPAPIQHGLGAIIGEIEANGLRQDGDNSYVTSAYGSAPVTVNVTIEQGAGTIVLEQARGVVEGGGQRSAVRLLARSRASTVRSVA